jgi:MFS family permease
VQFLMATMVPFVGLVAATAVAGPLIAKSGRYKIYPILGAVLTGFAMAALGTIGTRTSAIEIGVAMAVAGAGVGLFVQVALLAGQNSAEHRHLGVATGALNFFESVSGAFGAALFGAILTHGLGHGAAVPAFREVFLWTTPFMALAFVLALVMPEKPLSEEMAEVARGEAEVPEY